MTAALQSVRNNPQAQAHQAQVAQAHQAQVQAQAAQAQAQAQAQTGRPTLPQGTMHGNPGPMNLNILQNATKTYPSIDFSGITQEIVMNLPSQRFEARIKSYISERLSNGNNVNNAGLQAHTPQMPPRTPVPGPAAAPNPRIPTPGNDSNNNIPRLGSAPGINVDEIMKLHEQCQTVFRKTYESRRKFLPLHLQCNTLEFPPLALHPLPMPPNVNYWKERYGMAMVCMKPLIMGMGLYLYIRRDKEEMHNIILNVSLAPT